MTTLLEANELHQINQRLIREARWAVSSGIRRALGSSRRMDVDAVREALLELVPSILDTYGEAAGLAAAGWFDEQHRLYGLGTYEAVVADLPPLNQIEGTVRYAAGFADVDDMGSVENILNNSLSRYINDTSRRTVARNSMRDSAAHGWHRIARPGACDFCVFLAARGAAYRRDTADFGAHDDCGCRIAPSWDPSAPEVGVRQYEASDHRERSTPERRERNNARVRAWIEQNPGEIESMRSEL